MKTKLPKLTLPIIRSWKPCYDPAKFAPEKWQGNIIDILRCDKIPADDLPQWERTLVRHR